MDDAYLQDTPLARRVGAEAGKSLARKQADGFIDLYLSGAAILDIGYRGYIDDVVPVVAQAIGIELDYPGYDGRTLPFRNESQDAVYSSHCLEHIEDYRTAIRDWFRVTRIGGFLIIVVPHKFLYERRHALPSRWNEDHKRFYTPASLMAEVEGSLEPNSYRLRHLIDNDVDYDYAIPPTRHAGGCYEIELVIERIAAPYWSLENPPQDVDPSADGAACNTTLENAGDAAFADAATDAPHDPDSHRPSEPAGRPSLLQAAVLSAWRIVPRPLRRLVPGVVRARGGDALWRKRRSGNA